MRFPRFFQAAAHQGIADVGPITAAMTVVFEFPVVTVLDG